MRVEPVAALAEALRLCESPIEAQFLTAFFFVCVREAQSPDRSPGNIDAGASCIDKYSGIAIEPQVRIGAYRVDFLITYGTIRLVVECDGHDFHNVTEEQQINDRERDEWLADNDYTVFRITGSEIYGAANACAERAFYHCTDDEHTPRWRRLGRTQVGRFYPPPPQFPNPYYVDASGNILDVSGRIVVNPFRRRG